MLLHSKVVEDFLFVSDEFHFFMFQFQRDLKRLYYEDSILGGMARQIMYPPRQTYYFEKRCSPDGYSRRVSTLLPPRISLRWCANYYYILLFSIYYSFVKLIDYSFCKISFVFGFFYIAYLVMNSIFYPIPVPESEHSSTNQSE